MEFKKLMGQEILAHLEDIADLRITVFKEWPYLYEGDLEYEKKYLQNYVESSKSLAILAIEDKKIIGCSTAIAMEDADDEFSSVLEQMNFSKENVLYFAESIILKGHRGKGIGNKFFDFRESFAKELDREVCLFCSVQRKSSHPLSPKNYRSPSSLWRKRGYSPTENYVNYKWKDLGENSETSKALRVWYKKIK